MNPSQVIQLQALKLKSTVQCHNPQIVDAILRNSENEEEIKKDFRNVCALIHSTQFEELENLCTLLELSKRQVISMALTVFLEMANNIVSEVNPFENHISAPASEGQ